MYRIRKIPMAADPKMCVAGMENSNATLSTPLLPSAQVTRATASARAVWTSERIGLHHKARELYERALAEVGQANNEGPWELVGSIRNNLASLLRQTGETEKAEAIFVSTINELEQVPLPELQQLRSQIIKNLADLYYN
jgi:hypothetical protein